MGNQGLAVVAGRDLFDDPCRSRSAPECLRAKSLSGGKFIGSLFVECKVYQPACRNWQFAEAYHTTFGAKAAKLIFACAFDNHVEKAP